MTVFGWCLDNRHPACPGVVQKLVADKGKVIASGEAHCPCNCHGDSDAQ